jgi:sarcosine oxidase subunit gamma
MSEQPASEQSTRESGLDPIFAAAANTTGQSADFCVRLLPAMRHINLRGTSDDAKFVSAVAMVLGQELPVISNTMSNADHCVYWLGPDEWLVVTAYEDSDELMAQLIGVQENHHVAVTDVSGGNILLRLTGERVHDVLAKGCTLDFHSDAMTPGHCAQSGLAKASVLIGHIDDEPTWDVVVRRSFSEYLCIWLQSAGEEHGVTFSLI